MLASTPPILFRLYVAHQTGRYHSYSFWSAALLRNDRLCYSMYYQPTFSGQWSLRFWCDGQWRRCTNCRNHGHAIDIANSESAETGVPFQPQRSLWAHHQIEQGRIWMDQGSRLLSAPACDPHWLFKWCWKRHFLFGGDGRGFSSKTPSLNKIVTKFSYS